MELCLLLHPLFWRWLSFWAGYSLDGLEVNMEWISVEEQMPEIGSYVFVYLSERGFQEVPYVVTKFDKYGFNLSNVTHWMPLPEPPKN